MGKVDIALINTYGGRPSSYVVMDNGNPVIYNRNQMINKVYANEVNNAAIKIVSDRPRIVLKNEVPKQAVSFKEMTIPPREVKNPGGFSEFYFILDDANDVEIDLFKGYARWVKSGDWKDIDVNHTIWHLGKAIILRSYNRLIVMNRARQFGVINLVTLKNHMTGKKPRLKKYGDGLVIPPNESHDVGVASKNPFLGHRLHTSGKICALAYIEYRGIGHRDMYFMQPILLEFDLDHFGYYVSWASRIEKKYNAGIGFNYNQYKLDFRK